MKPQARLQTNLIGILTILLCSFATTVFAGVTFSDGSTSKTFPTVTLKKKTFKIFRKKYTRKWTMDSYARISESNAGTVVSGRTQVKSTFHLIGFTGGAFVDVKDSKGNLIYRISCRTGNEATGLENGHDVGWGVNPRKTRVLSWEVIIPPEIALVGSTVDIYQRRTKKKVDWAKVKAKFSKIANNLAKAIKEFFESNGDEVIILAVKYGPQIIEMNEAAEAGTLELTDVLELMNNILADAKEYEIISSAKAQYVVNIISAVNQIVINGSDGWEAENQEMLMALIEDITTAVGEKNIDDATLVNIVDNFEAFLSNKAGLIPANLEPIETILVNTKALVEDKLNSQQLAIFSTVIEFVNELNNFDDEPLLQQEKLDCIFAAARSIINIRSQALAGTLTADYVNEQLNSFLDMNYAVLGLNDTQNAAIQTIVDSIVNIVNNSTEGFLPANQEQIVNLIIQIEQIAAAGSVDYDQINSLIDDLETLCSDKSGFAPSSFVDIENILISVQTLIEPKLNDDSKVIEVLASAISIINSINNLGDVPVVDNMSVIFNGVRLGVDLLEQAQNGSITPEYAESQINEWYTELEPVLKEMYPDKADQIDAVKAIIDNTFAIMKSGDEGWTFEHWEAIVSIVKVGLESIQNDNIFEIADTVLNLKADLEVILGDKSGFVVENATYIQSIIENLDVLCANNEKIHEALSSLIELLEEYNSYAEAA